MHPRQHAYQAGKSIESALHQLVGRIEKALDAKAYALGIFFDIEGAFHNIPTTAVATALESWEIQIFYDAAICIKAVYLQNAHCKAFFGLKFLSLKILSVKQISQTITY